MTKIIFVLVFLFSLSQELMANEYKKGQVSKDGMIYLYQEPIEMYWNNWAAKKLHEGKFYISGEGKTVSFDGVITLNCESSSGYRWIVASNYGDALSREVDFNNVIPIQVISAAFEEFC